MGRAIASAHSRGNRPVGGVLELIEVRVPDEQEGTKAVVRAWLRQVGDLVFENEPLVELETVKVTQEVPAPAAGVLAEIVLDTDAEAVPGALLARIETEGAAAPTRAREKPEAGQERILERATSANGEIETRLSP